MKPLYIFGASGHAKVVLDVALKAVQHDVRGFLDDDPAKWGSTLLGYPILGGKAYVENLIPGTDCLFVAIGNCRVRHGLGREFQARGFELPTLIHPSAVIGLDVEIGPGTIVVGGVVINPSARIGSHCILNTGCSVDHDCVVADGAHICPGARLAGHSRVGVQSWIGIGSCVIECRAVGDRSTVAAGAAVIQNVPDDTKVIGVPARPMSARPVNSQ